jgi:hypothetical protein
MDRRITAAVVEPVADPWLGLRPVIPQETCVMIAVASADEAHYLCALLNSEPAHRLVSSFSVRGGKGFGTPGMLDYLRLRRFEPDNSLHQDLAALSREAHERIRKKLEVADIQQGIDQAWRPELFAPPARGQRTYHPKWLF